MGSPLPRLDLTPSQWRRSGGNQAFRFLHDLADHPLLELEALAQLADRLDPARIEITEAASPVVVDQRVTQRVGSATVGVSPGDLVRRAEADHRWMAIRNVETDPAYADLVDHVFTAFLVRTESARGDVYRPEGYVFIGASGAVTPAHVDHEHNLFCQVRGTKHFTVGSFPDEERRHRTFEGMYGDEYGSTPFPPAAPVTHVLGPGDGLYVPPTALHLVENTDSLAVSFSLVFHDAALDRSARVYAFNAHLRRAGLQPSPPGRSLPRDRVKAVAVDGWRRAKIMLSDLRARVS